MTERPKVLIKDYDILDSIENNHLHQLFLNLPLDGNYPQIPENRKNLSKHCDPNWTYIKIYLNEKEAFAFSESRSKTDHVTKTYFRKLMGELNKENFSIDSEFINNYLQLLRKHPLNVDGQIEANLIINHCHMFLNRLFLEEAPETETLVWYLVYRNLGKKIFGGQIQSSK